MLGGCAAILLATSCATTPSTTGANPNHFPFKYLATDGRTIEIGPRTAMESGWNFKEPHLDKCWIRSDFDFNGYDTLYIAPTLSSAKLHGPEEESPHELAKENLVIELTRSLRPKKMFTNIVTHESDFKPGTKVLKLEITIVEYAKGGGAARYWAGLYGAGQPRLVVEGKITDGDKILCSFKARRSGVSMGARLSGAFMKDEDIQLDDIRSLVLDFTDFSMAIAGKYQPLK